MCHNQQIKHYTLVISTYMQMTLITMKSITFMDTLESYNLKNRITFPTHIKQHQLDLVIEDKNDSIITQVERGFLLSDHFLIHTTISILKPKPQGSDCTIQEDEVN